MKDCDMTTQYNKRHGGPWDRGSADSYYGRKPNPHFYVKDTGNSKLVMEHDMTSDEIEAYYAGYDWNEENGDKKEW
jgi:hypothetical protein